MAARKKTKLSPAKKAALKKIIQALFCGENYQRTVKELVKFGREGVDAVLDGGEGKYGPIPKDRHPMDVYDDLYGALFGFAKSDPNLLIETLARRPKHTMHLIWALGGASGPAAEAALIKATQDPEKWVRWGALCGLTRKKKKSLLPLYLKLLRDRSSDVCFVALEGVAQNADKTAIEPLEAYLKRKNIGDGARMIAENTLKKLTRRR